MSTVQNLLTDISVTLAAAATTTVAHGLVSTSGVGLLPFEVRPDRATPIVVTAATTSTVSFRNDGADSATAIFRAWHYTSTAAPSATTTLKWAGTTAAAAAAVVTSEMTREIAIAPDDTIKAIWHAPTDITVTGLRLYAETAPASALGTYLFSVTGGGNNLISTATYSLESLVSDTLTELTLTGTLADLDIDAGEKVETLFVSDNADLTGEGLLLQLLYVRR